MLFALLRSIPSPHAWNCLVMCAPAWNCNVNSANAELCVISASVELCFVWFPQAQNCVLNVVSASAELRVLCIV